jgi:hypothetical protein
MDEDKKVWVPHPTEGFKMGRIVDIGSDTISVEPFGSPGQVTMIYIVLFVLFTCWNPVNLPFYRGFGQLFGIPVEQKSYLHSFLV